MMMKKKPLAILIGQVFGLVALATAAGVAQAQQAAPERITVTGSRIPQPSLESSSPVTIIGADSIKMDGVTTIENMLNNLPQVFADQGGNLANGATGTATVNLRNLGADRTLVLINGRRLPAGSPIAGGHAADLNQIPTQLVKQVEVLTGGAGAVYGSDAVAGVVNFIMNDRFEGVQVDINHSFYNHEQDNALVQAATRARNFPVPGDVDSDGKNKDISLILGSNFAGGKGNATVFFSYKKQNEVTEAARDFSACALSTSSTGYSCAGSSTTNPARFWTQGGAGPSYTMNSDGTVRGWKGAPDQFNYAPYNHFLRPDERYGFNAFAHYDIADKTRVYAEFGFHDDRTVAQVAPSGLFGLQTTVNYDNPLLSDSWRTTLGLLKPGDSINDLIILRRNVEGGPRQDDIRNTSYRGVIGLKGEVANNWNYDAYMSYGKVLFQETYLNDFSRTKSARAMNVVKDPATGLPVCQSVLDGSDPSCVPYDIWRIGGVTPAATSYLQTPLLQKGFTSQSIFSGTLSSDLGKYGIKIPLAKNGVGLAFGAEYRKESMELVTDSGYSSFDGFGQGGPVIGLVGQYIVKEYFFETKVPLIEGREFAHSLAMNLSYRNSDYDTGFKTDSYGLGLDWAPIKEAKLRGSYQRAVRAANLQEMFTAQGNNLFSMDDEACSGATPKASLAECQRTGVTAAQYGNIAASPAGQYNTVQGGNAALKPEKADSYTLGLVLTPMRNMSATLDFWSIKVEGEIGTAPPEVILEQCLATGDAKYCGLIHRDTAGSLWLLPSAGVTSTNLNLGTTKTTGFDIALNYMHRIDAYGKLGFDFVGTKLNKFESEPLPGLGKYDCAGLFGSTCGTPAPEWRHKLRLTWFTPWDAEIAVTWRHLDAVKMDVTSSNPKLSDPTYDAIDTKMKKQEYIDVSGSWAVTKHITLRGGINNLFDETPTVISSSIAGPAYGNGNTYPQVYDTLGRFVFLNATAKF